MTGDQLASSLSSYPYVLRTQEAVDLASDFSQIVVPLLAAGHSQEVDRSDRRSRLQGS